MRSLARLRFWLHQKGLSLKHKLLSLIGVLLVGGLICIGELPSTTSVPSDEPITAPVGRPVVSDEQKARSFVVHIQERVGIFTDRPPEEVVALGKSTCGRTVSAEQFAAAHHLDVYQADTFIETSHYFGC